MSYEGQGSRADSRDIRQEEITITEVTEDANEDDGMTVHKEGRNKKPALKGLQEPMEGKQGLDEDGTPRCLG